MGHLNLVRRNSSGSNSLLGINMVSNRALARRSRATRLRHNLPTRMGQRHLNSPRTPRMGRNINNRNIPDSSSTNSNSRAMFVFRIMATFGDPEANCIL